MDKISPQEDAPQEVVPPEQMVPVANSADANPPASGLVPETSVGPVSVGRPDVDTLAVVAASATEPVAAQTAEAAVPAPAVATSPNADLMQAAPAAVLTPVARVDRLSDEEVEAQMRRLSRRGFLWAGVSGVAAYTGWRWLFTRHSDDGVEWPLRRALNFNGDLAQDYFSGARLAPVFPTSRAREPRVNGEIGMDGDFDVDAWRLHVSGLASGEDLALPLSAIKALPRVEMVTEMKCIEGWAVVVHWAGARLADFVAKYPPATQSGAAPDVLKKPEDLLPYLGAATPNGGYYVGLEMESVLHPQTLLCYEMNGEPLTLDHGAPLRLVTPVKYGIKHIKRLGTLNFSAHRPADYWAEQGYDWYAGH